MSSREQLIAGARAGKSYEELGREFGIAAGQAYLIVTGLPADGSDALGPEYLESRKEFLIAGGSQQLVNPPTDVITTDPGVHEWLQRLAAADVPMQQAAAARTAEPPAM